MKALIEELQSADLVVGYNLLEFDYQVLSGYRHVRFQQPPTLDMMQDLAATLGFRLRLDAVATATLFQLVPPRVVAEEPGRPNVLLIMTDDQGWGDLRSHGNERIETPTLDRLADQGARFDRFYVCPVCAPTRASLLTGRYHLRGGVHGVTRGRENLRSEEVTIAELLHNAGYATGCFGKWHNGAHYPMHPNGQGFDEFLGFCAGHWNNYFDTTLERNGTPVKTRGFITDVLTDAALEFIKQHRQRPFFCYVPYNAPHSPWQVPDRYFDKYKRRGLDDTTACAYAMCENIDDNVGRLLARLDELGLAERTIVLFLTDNGPNTDRYNGDMRGRKGSVHEGGVRVPLLVRWPGRIRPGRTVSPIASAIDLLPTLLELTGVQRPQGLALDGVSLAPLLLAGDRVRWSDRRLFTFRGQGERGAVRTQRWRATLEGRTWQLYDMQADPAQKRNVGPDFPMVLDELQSAYAAQRREVTAQGFEPLPIPVGHAQRDEVELPGHEAFLEPPNRQGISYHGPAGWANDWITNWSSLQAYPRWEVEVTRPGRYKITLLYICPPDDVGAEVQVEVAGRQLTGRIPRPHAPDALPSPDRVPRKEVYEKSWAPLPLGEVSLPAGRTQLLVRALSKPGRQVMDLKAVRIRRLGDE